MIFTELPTLPLPIEWYVIFMFAMVLGGIPLPNVLAYTLMGWVMGPDFRGYAVGFVLLDIVRAMLKGVAK